MQQKGKLAALLFTDLAAFNDTEQQHQKLDETEISRLKLVFQQSIEAFGGNIQHTHSGGSICIFDSASQAIKAAMHFQSKLKNEKKKLPNRIGLHIDEIWTENGNVPEGIIDIVSGIHSIEGENTILFSNDFYQQIKSQPEFEAVLIGSFGLKNPDHPVTVYALANEGFTVQKKSNFHFGISLKNLKRTPFLILIPAILTILFLGWLWWKNKGTEKIAPLENTIAILPFLNLDGNKNETRALCIGMQFELQRKLEWIGGFTTISAQSVEKFRGLQTDVQKISNELGGVKFLVSGTVQSIGNRAKVYVTLFDAPAGKKIWTQVFHGETLEIFNLQETIARQIGEKVNVKIMPAELTMLKKMPTQNSEALLHYIAALDFFVKETFSPPASTTTNTGENPSLNTNLQNIFSLCNKALQSDPLMADAILLKSKTLIYRYQNASSGTGEVDSIRSLCRQALSLKPDWSEIYILLSQLQHEDSNIQPDPVTGLMPIQLMEKVLEMNPDDFDTNKELGYYYSVKDPDPERSIHHYKTALRINPLSPWIANTYLDFATPYWNIYEYPVAEYYLKKATELSPNPSVSAEAMKRLCSMFIQTRQPDSVFRYSQLLLAMGDNTALYFSAEVNCILLDSCQKACDIYALAWSRFPDNGKEHRWGYALWKTGKKEEGSSHIKQALDFFRENKKKGLRENYNYELAGIYAFLGDNQKALEILKNMNQDNCWNMGMLNLIKIDPLFKSLQNESVFNQVIAAETEKRLHTRESIRKMEEDGTL